MRPLNSTPLEGAASVFLPRSRASDVEEEQQETEAGPHAVFTTK